MPIIMILTRDPVYKVWCYSFVIVIILFYFINFYYRNVLMHCNKLLLVKVGQLLYVKKMILKPKNWLGKPLMFHTLLIAYKYFNIKNGFLYNFIFKSCNILFTFLEELFLVSSIDNM